MTPSTRAALALVLALAAAPARAADVRATPLEGPAPRRPEHPRGSAAVAYTTAGRAYFDAGAADGLAPGAAVTARRGEARCAVDLVAEHAASCPSTAFRAGDHVAFQPAASAAPEPKVLPAVVSDEDLGRRASLLQAAPGPALVEYKSASPAGGATPEVVAASRSRWLFADASYAQWSSSGSPELGAAALELGIHGAPIGGGVLLDLAARGERWVPGPNSRFRSSEATRFYLWQAEITAPISRFAFSAGRVLPYAIPGATVFDGGSAAVQVGPAQVGVFGGLVPKPDTLSPATDRATGGAFWALSHVFAGGTGFRQDGRLAVVRSPELGTRFEGSVGAGAWLKAAYVSAEAQLGVGGATHAPGYLDAARADLTLRVAQSVSVGGGYRHTGLEWPDPNNAWDPARFPGRSDAADGWLSWDVWQLRVGGRGGFSRDASTKLDRSWVGPELGIPRLFGRWGGVLGGYQEERGWLAGRSAWVQATLRPSSRWSLSLRGTWTHARDAALDADEVGLVASGSAELGHGFGLRAALLTRAAVGVGGEGDGGGGSTPLGVTGTVGLYASY